MKEELIEKALELFGTTEDCNVGAFLLPNGELIDFELPNGGREEHAQIQMVYDEKSYPGKPDYKKITDFLHDTGSMRFHQGDNTTWIEISALNEPTFEQIETLRNCACYQGLQPHRIIYDIREEDGHVERSNSIPENVWGREIPCSGVINRFMRDMIKEFGAR